MGDKRREGLVLFLFNIFRVYQLELLEITLILEITQPTSADISSQRLVHPAADEDFVICWNAHVDKCSFCQADVWCILQLMMTLLNYFTLCKNVLCIWRKNIFFCHHNFTKKVILSCLKMNLKISYKLRQLDMFVKGIKN